MLNSLMSGVNPEVTALLTFLQSLFKDSELREASDVQGFLELLWILLASLRKNH